MTDSIHPSITLTTYTSYLSTQLSLPLLQVVTTFFDFPMVFSVESGESVSDMSRMDTMMSGPGACKISPDGKLVAVSSSDGSVKVVELTTGEIQVNLYKN